MLLMAGGSIQIAHDQVASIDEWIRNTESINSKEMGQELHRLVTQLESIAKRQENVA